MCSLAASQKLTHKLSTGLSVGVPGIPSFHIARALRARSRFPHFHPEFAARREFVGFAPAYGAFAAALSGY